MLLGDGLGHDLDCLGERVPEQPDLDIRALDSQDRVQVPVCLEPQRGFSLTQHDGETPGRAGRDRRPLAFDTNVRDGCHRGGVDDDAGDDGRFLSRDDGWPREQEPGQEKVGETNDRAHRESVASGAALSSTRAPTRRLVIP